MSIHKKMLLLMMSASAHAAQKELIKEKLIRFPEFRDPFSWLAPLPTNQTIMPRDLFAKKEVLAHRPKPVAPKKEIIKEQPAPAVQEALINVMKEIQMPEKEAEAVVPPTWTVVGVAHSGARPLALLAHEEHGTKLARLNDDLGQGWRIGKITANGIVCKHVNGAEQELVV